MHWPVLFVHCIRIEKSKPKKTNQPRDQILDSSNNVNRNQTKIWAAETVNVELESASAVRLALREEAVLAEKTASAAPIAQDKWDPRMLDQQVQ